MLFKYLFYMWYVSVDNFGEKILFISAMFFKLLKYDDK